jgi:hypothetical protein
MRRAIGLEYRARADQDTITVPTLHDPPERAPGSYIRVRFDGL